MDEEREEERRRGKRRGGEEGERDKEREEEREEDRGEREEDDAVHKASPGNRGESRTRAKGGMGITSSNASSLSLCLSVPV